jgi:hypothetical protein
MYSSHPYFLPHLPFDSCFFLPFLFTEYFLLILCYLPFQFLAIPLDSSVLFSLYFLSKVPSFLPTSSMFFLLLSQIFLVHISYPFSFFSPPFSIPLITTYSLPLTSKYLFPFYSSPHSSNLPLLCRTPHPLLTPLPPSRRAAAFLRSKV